MHVHFSWSWKCGLFLLSTLHGQKTVVGGQYIQNDKTKVDNPVLLSILLFYFKVQYLLLCRSLWRAARRNINANIYWLLIESMIIMLSISSTSVLSFFRFFQISLAKKWSFLTFVNLPFNSPILLLIFLNSKKRIYCIVSHDSHMARQYPCDSA